MEKGVTTPQPRLLGLVYGAVDFTCRGKRRKVRRNSIAEVVFASPRTVSKCIAMLIADGFIRDRTLGNYGGARDLETTDLVSKVGPDHMYINQNGGAEEEPEQDGPTRIVIE